MLTKISRKISLQKFPWVPHASLNRNKMYFPKTYGKYTLTVGSKFIRSYIKEFTKEFERLILELELDSLLFIGDNGLPWLFQKHSYSKVKSAVTYLKKNKVTKEFNGGVLVDKQELIEFTKHLFWLTRCCAALPYFHFTDEKQNVIGHICQYGNLHIYTLNKSIEKKLSRVINSTKLIQIPELSCYNKFGKTSAIRHRQTIV